MTTPPAGQALDFEQNIKPLFRPKDQHAMASRFDLWSESDVAAHASAILDQLHAGTMPCDGAWPADKIELFERWVDQLRSA